jgi:4-amino-4-deoxy-L-arabinose transferase-like glycosyltransferase
MAIILLVWACTMLVGLGNTALWEPDEPRFAGATREMFSRGDFLTPWFNAQPRFEKPVLLYWLQAPFVAVLGPTETAFRLPSALAGLVTLIVVFRIASRLVSPAAGLYAALALATTFRFVLYARQGLTDVPVTAFVSVAIWGFLRAFDAPAGRSRGYALAAWGATGCAALTKGPVAVLGPLVWGVFAAAGDWRAAWRRLHVPSGILVAAAVALPWFALMTAWYGHAFLDVALGYEVVNRYLSPDFPGPDRGFTYFFGAWIGDGAPWSLFFVAAAVWAARSWRTLDEGTRRAVRLAAVWWAAVLLVFSFSSYKLPHYIMPAYPATALLAGIFADAVARGALRRLALWRVPVALTALLLAAGAVLLGLLLRRAFELPLLDPSFGLIVLLAAGALALVASLVFRRDRAAPAILIGTLTVSYLWLILVVSPRELRRFQPIPQLARSVQRTMQPGDPLAVAGNYGAPGLVFYADRPVRQLIGRDELVAYLSEPGPRACVLPRTDFEDVAASVPQEWHVVDEAPIFSVRMRRLLESEPERAGRTLMLVTKP